MRRWLSILLSMTLLVCTVLPGSAFAADTEVEKQVKSIDAARVSAQLGADIDVITYSNLSVDMKTERDSNCRMTFTLHVGPDAYKIVVAGILDEYELSRTNRIFHGCLRGEVEIKGTVYKVTAGLTKEADSDNMNAGIVLMPVGNGWSDDIITFAIGDYVMPENVKRALMGDNVYSIATEKTDNAVVNNRDIDNALSVEGTITRGSAQAIAVHATPNTNTVRAYVNAHFSYTGQGAGASFSLDSLQAGVRHNSSLFNLVGIYEGGVDLNGEHNGFRNVVWAVIYDVLSYFDVPTETLSELIDWFANQNTDPVDNRYANNYSVTLSGNRLFDGIEEVGLACEFATGGNISGDTGIDTATTYGNASFDVVQNIPLSGPMFFYLDAVEETDVVYVTVG